MKKKIVVIGGGFGGLAVAALLAKNGHEVRLLEKNGQLGGRARRLELGEFGFDVGPSWYFMPEVFERFFGLFDRNVDELYHLQRLDPSYRVFFSPEEFVDIRTELDANEELFESLEPGSFQALKEYLQQAASLYDMSMKDFLYRDISSLWDFVNGKLLLSAVKSKALKALGSYDKVVSKYFDNTKIKRILEFATVFIGGSPFNLSGLYTLLSHVDLQGGVWYPEGGMKKMVDGFETVCRDSGVELLLEHPVESIEVRGGKAVGVKSQKGFFEADVVVANADYAHVEQQLLGEEYRSYPASYWDKMVLSPGVFKLCLGLNGKLEKARHHNLFLEMDWEDHFSKVFDHAQWPEHFSYYISIQSADDPTLAPEGKEAVDFLVPIAPGLEDTPANRQKMEDILLEHSSTLMGQSLGNMVEQKECLTIRDFQQDFHALRGSAFGPAHTLRQTASGRPANRSKKVDNLYFAGHYVHPGVGMPMVVIAAEIVAKKVQNALEGR
ncbi:MAG TPA: phytoene desaturase family protein [Thermotogota bacterium]|nr:phytoene desaturase family protein [Thermotogota bacterium]HRW93247.1 phytoene desaturase family protein [Thermotogota bacterium]